MDIGTSYRLGGKVLRNDIKEKIYASWLDSICWLNRSVKHKLLSKAGSAVEIYKLSDKELLVLIGEKDAERILEILPISQDDIINRLRQNENTSTVSQICQGIMELEINKMIKRTSGGIRVEGI